MNPVLSTPRSGLPAPGALLPAPRQSARALLVAIHGIMTSQTDASWPDHLDAFAFRQHPEIKVLKK